MSNSELSPQGNQNPLAKLPSGDQARRTREAYNAKASSDFYGAVGWMVGFLITTLFLDLPDNLVLGAQIVTAMVVVLAILLGFAVIQIAFFVFSHID